VFQAVNTEDHRVAACKVVALTPKTTQPERKALDKEMRVHAALKHANVLEFLTAVVVESGIDSPYVPAIYMLLEFAAGGDLFDKIGTFPLVYYPRPKTKYAELPSTKLPTSG
jgi:serine/threonine-protein kinase Chk1